MKKAYGTADPLLEIEMSGLPDNIAKITMLGKKAVGQN